MADRFMWAGVAKRDITDPKAGHRVRDRLYAKALVLQNHQTRLAVVTMDTTAIGARQISDHLLPDVGESFLPRLQQKVACTLNIPAGHLMVNASHTHPPGRLLCDDDQQVQQVFDAVREAADNLTPVHVGAGVGYESRISINRNIRLKNGRDWTIRHAYPCPPEEAVNAAGPIDPQIGIIRIDRQNGQPLAVIYNFACHLLFADTHGHITANFPGITSNRIEQHFGEQAMAFFIQGACGDIIDARFKDFTHPRDVEPLGHMLADSTIQALSRIDTGPTGQLHVLSRTLDLPRRSDFPLRMAELKNEQAELLESMRHASLNFRSFLPLYLQQQLHPQHPAGPAYQYLHHQRVDSDRLAAMGHWNRLQVDKYLQNLQAMERLAVIQDDLHTLAKHHRLHAQANSSVVPAPIQTIRIGQAAIVTAPFEPLVQIGLRVKAMSPFEPTLMAGFTNGYLHYGPPADAYDRGGYEVRECLLAPQWQAVFEENVSHMLQHL